MPRTSPKPPVESIDRSALAEYLASHITALQQKHNFHPDAGAAQVVGTKLARAYGQYEALRALAQKFGIAMPLSYDPVGGTDQQAHESPTRGYVYFLRKSGPDNRTWKVGESKAPQIRKNSLQTGNEGTLETMFKLEYPTKKDAKVVEDAVKEFVQPHKTRNLNSPGCEWFYADLAYVKRLVAGLRSDGIASLDPARHTQETP